MNDLNINFYRNLYNLRDLSDPQIIEHWNYVGKKESNLPNMKVFRRYYPEFNWKTYIKQYPELNILTRKEAILHCWNNQSTLYKDTRNGSMLFSKNKVNDKKLLTRLDLTIRRNLTGEKELTSKRNLIRKNKVTGKRDLSGTKEVTEVTDGRDLTRKKKVTDKRDLSGTKEVTDGRDLTRKKKVTDKRDLSGTKEVTEVTDGRDLTRKKKVTGKRDLSGTKEVTDGRDLTRKKKVTGERNLTRKKEITVGRDLTRKKEVTSERDLTGKKEITGGRDLTVKKEVTDERDLTGKKKITVGRDLTEKKEVTDERDLTGNKDNRLRDDILSLMNDGKYNQSTIDMGVDMIDKMGKEKVTLMNDLINNDIIRWIEDSISPSWMDTYISDEVDDVGEVDDSWNRNESGGYADVTVIINAYETPRHYLVQSVDSCLKQEGVNVYIIFVTVEGDSTVNIMKRKYGHLLSRQIRLIEVPRNQHPGRGVKGIYYQLNCGLKEVKTRYVTYFSSNDEMLPGKLANEIRMIEERGAIVCFSGFRAINTEGKVVRLFGKRFRKVDFTYEMLLERNYPNDCAMIDIGRLGFLIEFNYEKYGNTCFWELWLRIAERYGIKSICYNPIVSWVYIKDPNISLHLNISDDEREIRWNQVEFMLSYHNKRMKPRMKFEYQERNELIWWWNDETNEKPVEMTVALPALNAENIIWLALESLRNQEGVEFAWELICFEEEGRSREIIKEYVGKLPGCVRIIHRTVNPNEGFYNIGRYTLLEKWINIAHFSDKDSKIFVKQACDCYSPPKRLYIHQEHFKNSRCYYSTQVKGHFYNIINDKWLIYDGNMLEPKTWSIMGNPKVDNKDVKIRCCHLNMALRTDIIRWLKLPIKPILKGIDGYIIMRMFEIIGIRPEEEKIIFTDDEIDVENWKYSLDTDGYNNISMQRRNFYEYPKMNWYIPINDISNCLVPQYIIDRLKVFK